MIQFGVVYGCIYIIYLGCSSLSRIRVLGPPKPSILESEPAPLLFYKIKIYQLANIGTTQKSSILGILQMSS
jgi:hypothetical protein